MRPTRLIEHLAAAHEAADYLTGQAERGSVLQDLAHSWRDSIERLLAEARDYDPVEAGDMSADA